MGQFILRWLPCIMGTVWLVLAVAMTGRTMIFLQTSVAATGTVVSNVRIEQRDSENQRSTTFAPEFTFTSADGKTYTVTSTQGSNPPDFAEGQTVRVLYNPVNPGNARIDSFRQMWFLPILFGAFGIVFGAIGCTWMYFVVKRNRDMLLIR